MRQIGVGTFHASDKMKGLVNEVLASGRISHGPFCRQFEQRFAGLHGCRFAVTSNSGTDSLRIALQTLKEIHGWTDGDEVIVPAVTFVATVNIVLQCNMTPALVDVEPRMFGIDTDKIPEAFTSKTRAIVPVHLFGMPCDMDRLTQHVPLKNVKIIEDACETMFAHHKNRKVGSWGDIGCFSTYTAHLISSGVGGIATTNNPDYAAKMRSLVNHGRDGIYTSIDDDNDLSGEGLREVVSRRFNFESIGYSSRITEMECALAVAQLDDWQEMIAKRQWNAAYLMDGLRHLEDRLQLPEIRPHTSHSFMMMPLVLRDGVDKWDFCNHLEEHGIETRELMRLTDQPCYKGLWDPDDYPVAKMLNKSGLYCGIHQGLTREDLDYMIEVMNGYFAHNQRKQNAS